MGNPAILWVWADCGVVVIVDGFERASTYVCVCVCVCMYVSLSGSLTIAVSVIATVLVMCMCVYHESIAAAFLIFCCLSSSLPCPPDPDPRLPGSAANVSHVLYRRAGQPRLHAQGMDGMHREKASGGCVCSKAHDWIEKCKCV